MIVNVSFQLKLDGNGVNVALKGMKGIDGPNLEITSPEEIMYYVALLQAEYLKHKMEDAKPPQPNILRVEPGYKLPN